MMANVIGLAASGSAMAWTLGDPETPSTIDLHGFVSQGYIKSTDNDYLVDSSGGGSFEFSEAGINFTVQPLDRLSIGLQLFAYNLGTSGNFTLRADWFYLDYHFRDWLGIRAGRVKLVYGLYNDISDIDAARTPILLPPSIYPLSNRDLLFGVQGGEVYGYARLGFLGGLEYRAVGGAIDIPLPSQIGQSVQASNVDIPYMVAGRLMWETPLDGLRVGGSVLALRLNEDVFFPGVPAAMATESARATLYGDIGSIEYVAHDLQLAAEYAQTRNESRSSRLRRSGLPRSSARGGMPWRPTGSRGGSSPAPISRSPTRTGTSGVRVRPPRRRTTRTCRTIWPGRCAST